LQAYTFTDKAESDLERIIDFTLEHLGKHQAVKYVDGLEELSQTVADNPGIGIARDELSTDLFSIPYQSHILYYMQSPSGITVVRVLHASMDSVNHF